MFFKKKQEEAHINTLAEVNEIEEEEEEIMKDYGKETVEELMDKIVDHTFVSKSPVDGNLISVVRTEDVMGILCEYFGIDGKTTSYGDYC